MGLMIKEIIILFIYMIGINFVLVGFANLGSGISCPDLYQVSLNTSYNASEISSGVTSNPISMTNMVRTVIQLVTNSCIGIPYVLVLLFEVPILIGFAYIIRGFIGAT